MDDLKRAYGWLKWQVDKHREAVTPQSGLAGISPPVAMAGKVFAALSMSPCRSISVSEDDFTKYLASIGKDGPVILSACLGRGWIEPIEDNGKGLRLLIDETRLKEDAAAFGTSCDSTDL